MGHREPLRVIGPSNAPEVLVDHPEVFDTSVAEAGELILGPLTVRLSPVEHRDLECWATRVGDALCYTADTRACAALDELAYGCRVLLSPRRRPRTRTRTRTDRNRHT